MRIKTDPFHVAPGERVDLARRPTRVDPVYETKSDYRKILKHHVKALSRLQQAHYAAGRAALLVIVQALDAGGKDGVIRHVMSGVNPQGCQVTSFKPPSEDELRHDFLWRSTVQLPKRGQIGIFNRSYYEEVLVVRVHPQMREAEGAANTDGGKFWAHRFESINALETHLVRNDTRIVKVFLHLSKDEQRRRFLKRIDRPEKTWKLDPADITERRHWDEYRDAYEACLSATSSDHAPWLVVPADDKKTARLIVSQAVLDALEALHPSFPEPTQDRRRALADIRSDLENGA